MRIATATLASLLLAVSSYAQPPERKVDGTRVTSRSPAIRITVPKEATYVGADRWPLYDVADCEVHVFVEADATKRVQRLYWIQFEAYLPSKPDSTYNYDRDQVTTMNGLEVRHRERFGPSNEKPRAGSDGERVMRMVASAGYTLPPDTVNSRLVHLPDASRRSEVMVIYIEDMAPLGKTSSDFLVDGKVSDAWAPVGRGVLARATSRISFERVSP